uniref:(northern house mosquito) hypothetical protein n=1 Tax=Culex pipiens TaxID=7175 RepID=A0A8D8KL60_CULPI
MREELLELRADTKASETRGRTGDCTAEGPLDVHQPGGHDSVPAGTFVRAVWRDASGTSADSAVFAAAVLAYSDPQLVPSKRFRAGHHPAHSAVPSDSVADSRRFVVPSAGSTAGGQK